MNNRMKIDISKINEVDAFSVLTQKSEVVESCQLSDEISHIEYEFKTYSIVEMSTGDIMAIPNDAIRWKNGR